MSFVVKIADQITEADLGKIIYFQPSNDPDYVHDEIIARVLKGFGYRIYRDEIQLTVEDEGFPGDPDKEWISYVRRDSIVVVEYPFLGPGVITA